MGIEGKKERKKDGGVDYGLEKEWEILRGVSGIADARVYRVVFFESCVSYQQQP